MTKRAYLKTDDRRRQLLDAAARLFVRDGYAGLTMVAVAAEAGVSRRLVYDHFADLASLYAAFFDDRAARYLAAINEAVDAAGDTASAFPAAFTQLLAMPADDQRAVRVLITDPGLPDLDPVRERFRRHVEEQWLDSIPAIEGDQRPRCPVDAGRRPVRSGRPRVARRGLEGRCTDDRDKPRHRTARIDA